MGGENRIREPSSNSGLIWCVDFHTNSLGEDMNLFLLSVIYHGGLDSPTLSGYHSMKRITEFKTSLKRDRFCQIVLTLDTPLRLRYLQCIYNTNWYREL